MSTASDENQTRHIKREANLTASLFDLFNVSVTPNTGDFFVRGSLQVLSLNVTTPAVVAYVSIHKPRELGGYRMPDVTQTETVEAAIHLKREKGISWTKLPQALYEATGVMMETHRIRDLIRSHERATTSKPERALALMITDVHVGKKTVSYNFSKCQERMRYLFDELLERVKECRRTRVVDAIHLCFIGDIIDNDSLYPTQAFHIDHEEAGNATEQIKLASAFFTELIVELKKRSKCQIIVHAVKGNHGRISKFTDEANNYDVMFYNNLEANLSLHKGISCNVSPSFYCLADVLGHRFLLNHGNGIKMYQNIPWYGLVQRTMRWAGSLPYHFDYVVVGHFHTSGEQTWNDKVIYMNGTAVTDDTFGLEVLGLSASNKFWLFGVEKGSGICYQHKIDLSEV